MVSISGSDSFNFGDEEKDFNIQSYYSIFESKKYVKSNTQNQNKKQGRVFVNLKKQKEDEKIIILNQHNNNKKKSSTSPSLPKIKEETLSYSSSPFEYSLNLDINIESIFTPNLSSSTKEIATVQTKKNVVRLKKTNGDYFETYNIFNIFNMINYNYSYFHFDYSQVDISYMYMFKLYNKLKLEYSRVYPYNVYNWKNVWYNISIVCYNICIKHQTFIADSFSGSFILSWAVLNLDEFKFGKFYDIVYDYMISSGNIMPSIKYIYDGHSIQSSKKKLFDRLAQYSCSLDQSDVSTGVNVFQPFPPIDLSFIE